MAVQVRLSEGPTCSVCPGKGLNRVLPRHSVIALEPPYRRAIASSREACLIFTHGSRASNHGVHRDGVRPETMWQKKLWR